MIFATPTGTPTSPRLPPSNLKVGRVGRWYLPLMAAISIGFGLANYIPAKMQEQERYNIREAQRIAENQRLMDAYGDKDSLRDLERAREFYER